MSEQLAEHFTVINYDRRGDSGDTAPYAVEREIGGEVKAGGGPERGPVGQVKTLDLRVEYRQAATV